MSKIATYSLADSPLQLSDRLIGTEAPRPTPSATPLATKNFSLGELLNLFSGNFPAANLQAVLDAGNTATQNITLVGTIDTTLIRPDNIEDTSGSQGTVFQFLSKGAVSINWVDLPVDNLQAVLNAGNTATQSITLVGNITSTRIIPGNIQDDTTGIGTTGQFLSKTASGIRWVNAPATTTPGLGDVLSVGNTAINNINLTGNVTATSFIKTGGTNLQYLMADGSVTTGGGAPLSALPFTTDHLSATNNQYVVGDLVWYLGDVYRCIASNDSIIPTSTLYWTNLGAGFPLVQQPADWNATSGNNQILNKPTTPTLQEVTDAGNTITDGTGGNLSLNTTGININYSTSGETAFLGYDGYSLINYSETVNNSSVFLTPIGGLLLTNNNEISSLNYSILGFGNVNSTAYYGIHGFSKTHYPNPNNPKTIIINFPTSIVGTDKTQTFQDADGTIALTTDIGVTSVGLTMPSAFNVANSPITSSGDIAVTGAGLVSQYVRGDGTLANFPNSTGGGSSVNYYLNGSVSQGTFGGDTYYQLSKTPILGAGTNFQRTNAQGNGYIASFITDAGDPSQLNIPGGNWNVEFYFQSSSTGGSPSFYAELYKVSATNVFTLIASDSANPEGITNGTSVDQYYTSIPVPQTTLLVTDRLAVRIFVTTSGKTITLHTENGNLSEVLTTFTTGLTALNGLTDQVQFFDVGTGATNFNISSSGDTHTFNLLFNIRRNANNSSNNNINYNGYAVTGSAESSAVWTITRLTIAASGSITTAIATNVAWTNRESAIYT